ncbi:MAG: acyltransferase [Endomicrobium sp.]|jgi:peptidoglycan/LPS O-acetylase OafA/YrhL|nr:acyltransferase [Endomicrobium sp.]
MSVEVKKGMIHELTGLRGLAALFILINHILLVTPYFNQTFIKEYLQHFAIIGMSLFFILSGFVIDYNYAEKIKSDPKSGILKFLVARFARLYPLYFVFIIGFFIFNLFDLPKDSSLYAANIVSLPTFLVGMQTWVYGFINGNALIFLQHNANISWSISSEVALYLLFIPMVIFVFRSNKMKWILGLLAFAVIGRFIWCYFSFSDPTLSNFLISIFGDHSSYPPWLWLVYHSPYGRMFEFLAGCAISRYYLNAGGRWRSKPVFVAMLLLALTGMIIVFMGKINMTIANHLFFPIFLIFIVFAVTQIGSKFLRSKPLLFVGDVSYSAYLFHIIFVRVFYFTGSGWDAIVLNIIAYIACTYLLAAFSYKYFETPARKYIREYFFGVIKKQAV